VGECKGWTLIPAIKDQTPSRTRHAGGGHANPPPLDKTQLQDPNCNPKTQLQSRKRFPGTPHALTVITLVPWGCAAKKKSRRSRSRDGGHSAALSLHRISRKTPEKEAQLLYVNSEYLCRTSHFFLQDTRSSFLTVHDHFSM